MIFLTLEQISSSEYFTAIENIAKINTPLLDQELETLPSAYAYYAGLLAISKEKCDLLSLDLAKIEANARMEERATLLKRGNKITEKLLDSLVLANDTYNEKRKEMILEETRYNLIKNILTTLSYKKDMLIQLSVNTRQEKTLYT